MSTQMDASLNYREVNKFKFCDAVAEEFIGVWYTFPQEEMSWMAQAEISTHVPISIYSNIQVSCCVFRLEGNWCKKN